MYLVYAESEVTMKFYWYTNAFKLLYWECSICTHQAHGWPLPPLVIIWYIVQFGPVTNANKSTVRLIKTQIYMSSDSQIFQVLHIWYLSIITKMRYMYQWAANLYYLLCNLVNDLVCGDITHTKPVVNQSLCQYQSPNSSKILVFCLVIIIYLTFMNWPIIKKFGLKQN